MQISISQRLSEELSQPEKYTENVIKLIDEGNTIPFIARYRKEAHGAMDDQLLRKLEERLKYLRNLEQRKQEVLSAIEAQGKLSRELRLVLENSETLSEVEEIYRPYKQKRRTRAIIAREKGLEPLAVKINSCRDAKVSLEKLAKAYVDPEKDVPDEAAALSGASDILAEDLANDIELRKKLKKLLMKEALLECRENSSKKDAAEDADKGVYDLYKDFSQNLSRLKDYQILAINRGEKEKVLKVSIAIDQERLVDAAVTGYIRKLAEGELKTFLTNMTTDACERLLIPSLENEIRSSLTEAANTGAIRNFSINLKPLLLQPPVKGSVTMGMDPGYRMGCKVAIVDATGKVLDTTVIYPTHGEAKRAQAIAELEKRIKKHKVEHIAIGNGTASRETEQMTADLLKKCPGVSYMVVSEAGASVYSASKLGAEEFPQYDVNVRSAISIARRLQDPLAELVKIEPKAIGVGQYQHDVPQKQLEESLDAVVEDCVNAVGVDLNTASESLLKRVAGLNATTAANLVAYREENGAYTSRAQIKKVPRLGAKAFEQCAGFLRVPESTNPLDNTGVHPESYKAAEQLLELCGYQKADMKKGSLSGLDLRVRQYSEAKLSKELGIGVPTLKDIVAELIKPGRDPREQLPAPIFRKDLLEMKDLKPGMLLAGTVRNVIDFGAFVDIGVHQDGLVHISEITDKYIKHPSEVLSVGQDVKVIVLDVDEKKKRISLSIKQAETR